MPRLPTSLLLAARKKDPLIVPILRTTRDLPSAVNEFRWLSEHVTETLPKRAERAQRLYDAQERVESPEVWETQHETATRLRQREFSLNKRRDHAAALHRPLLRKLAHARGRGTPLQYLLGTDYFGTLPVPLRVRKGVLIPRPETADIVTYLAQRLLQHRCALPTLRTEEARIVKVHSAKRKVKGGRKTVKVLDLCSGSGCMGLLLGCLLSTGGRYEDWDGGGGEGESRKRENLVRTEALGVDIDPKAVRLARQNLRRLLGAHWKGKAKVKMDFVDGDVLASPLTDIPTQPSATLPPANPTPGLAAAARTALQRDLSRRRRRIYSPRRPAQPPPPPLHTLTQGKTYDILLANPPYISPTHFRNGTTARSVRLFEPSLALVPPIIRAGSAPNVATGTKKAAERVAEGDTFYTPLLAHALRVDAKLVVMEVGDLAQALRVAALASTSRAWGRRVWDGVEVWRDGLVDPAFDSNVGEEVREEMMDGTVLEDREAAIRVLGEMGRNGRAVVCWRGDGAGWLGRSSSDEGDRSDKQRSDQRRKRGRGERRDEGQSDGRSSSNEEGQESGADSMWSIKPAVAARKRLITPRIRHLNVRHAGPSSVSLDLSREDRES